MSKARERQLKALGLFTPEQVDELRERLKTWEPHPDMENLWRVASGQP